MFALMTLMRRFDEAIQIYTAPKSEAKQEWAYHGALWNTTVHWNDPRVFSTYVYSRDPSRKVCFSPPHDDITKTEGLHFSQKNLWLSETKALVKAR